MRTQRSSVVVAARLDAVRWQGAALTGSLLFALLVATVVPARAQAGVAPTDPRWQPWLGCWRPVSGPVRPAGDTAPLPLVCVVPAAGSAGVDVVTVAGGRITSRVPIDATGAQRPVAMDRCTGWQSARFAERGGRVFLNADYTCPGNLRRTTSELMAISPQGEWLDVRGGSVQGRPTGVRVLRYRQTASNSAVPAELASATRGGRMETGIARASAEQPIRTSDVVEATKYVNPAVVEAWLVEEAQPFDLTGHKLLVLKHEGVPPRVLDVMVAVSYPHDFAFNLTTHQAVRRAAPQTAANPSYGPGGPGYGWGLGYASAWGCYDPFSWDCPSPYGWGYYSPYYAGSPYGYYSPYGLWGGFGYYPPGGVVVVNGGAGQTAHGQMIIGKGYTQGGAMGARAVPATPGAPAYRGGGEVYGRGWGGGWGGGGSRGASAPPPSFGGSSGFAPSSGGTPTGRRAVPRP